MEQLSHNLQTNIDTLKAYFHESEDFYVKPIEVCGVSCCVCMFEGLSSIERLWVMMLDVLSKAPQPVPTPQALLDYVLKQTAIPMENLTVATVEDVRLHVTAGASVVLIDGCNQGAVVSTQVMQFRSVQEASGEGNVRGSREGFVELVRFNVSFVRRLIRTGDLKVEFLTTGTRTKTEVALMYDAERIDKTLLKTVQDAINDTSIPFVFDSGYLTSFLQKKGFSFFQSVGYTERPDKVAAKICEGKLVLMVNGSPFAMILPYTFCENFQSMDDYATKAYFASFVRLLRYSAFFVAVMGSGLFVSICNFTPELLPAELLYKVAASEQVTPLPLFLEMLLVNLMLEIVREAGLRMPKPIGHSVSLVAAIIVGDAAVSAGLLSTPVVIVGALASICTYAVPSLYESITVLRLLFVLCAGLFGPIGIVALFVAMVVSACRMNSFGEPFTAPFAPLRQGLFVDGVLRLNWRKVAQDSTHDDRQEGAKP